MGAILDFRSEHFFKSSFYLKFTPKLPTPVRVYWPFSSEEAVNRFSRWRHGGHLGFSIGTILAIFDLQSTRCILPSFESIGLSLQEKKRKIDFQDGRHRGHLGFPIGIFSAIFTSHPDASYQVSSQ